MTRRLLYYGDSLTYYGVAIAQAVVLVVRVLSVVSVASEFCSHVFWIISHFVYQYFPSCKIYYFMQESSRTEK